VKRIGPYSKANNEEAVIHANPAKTNKGKDRRGLVLINQSVTLSFGAPSPGCGRGTSTLSPISLVRCNSSQSRNVDAEPKHDLPIDG